MQERLIYWSPLLRSYAAFHPPTRSVEVPITSIATGGSSGFWGVWKIRDDFKDWIFRQFWIQKPSGDRVHWFCQAPDRLEHREEKEEDEVGNPSSSKFIRRALGRQWGHTSFRFKPMAAMAVGISTLFSAQGDFEMNTLDLQSRGLRAPLGSSFRFAGWWFHER